MLLAGVPAGQRLEDQVDNIAPAVWRYKRHLHCSERRVPGETPGTTPGDGLCSPERTVSWQLSLCDSMKPSALGFNAKGGLNLREFFARKVEVIEGFEIFFELGG